jgi:hypothetical protein
VWAARLKGIARSYTGASAVEREMVAGVLRDRVRPAVSAIQTAAKISRRIMSPVPFFLLIPMASGPAAATAGTDSSRTKCFPEGRLHPLCLGISCRIGIVDARLVLGLPMGEWDFPSALRLLMRNQGVLPEGLKCFGSN